MLMPLAKAALLWERLWPRLWPVVGVSGLFVSLALFDVLPQLAYWLHGVILLGFTAAVLWTLHNGLKGLRNYCVWVEEKNLTRENFEDIVKRTITACGKTV